MLIYSLVENRNQKKKLTKDLGGEGAYPFCSVARKVFQGLLELLPSIYYLL